MNNANCPQCGGDLPQDAPLGLCPTCLLKGGLDGDVTSPLDASVPRFAAPAVEQLNAIFPALEILEFVGQGGMGAVYKVRQRSLDRIVALKILPQSFGKDPEFAERFAREARTLAQLNHPHIVVVHESGEAGGFFYLLMEYVDGVNLREAIRGRSTTTAQALEIIPQICEALQYAHDQGVVHRDIKPENVLLNRQGQIKIADFGLAKLLGQVPVELTLTQSQQVLGTIHYMAPEQLEQPLDVDHRADIYSLGVVFYELLTGHLPLGRFALPSEETPMDQRLDDVVLKTLERKPESRYQAASDVKLDVESIARNPRPAAASLAAAQGPPPVTVAHPPASAPLPSATPLELTPQQWERARQAVQVPGTLLIVLGVLLLALPFLVIVLGVLLIGVSAA